MVMKSSSSWKEIILCLLALPIAIGSNTFRVSLLILIADKWGTEAAMNYFHNFSSPLLFILSIALLLLLARILRFRFRTLAELTNG